MITTKCHLIFVAPSVCGSDPKWMFLCEMLASVRIQSWDLNLCCAQWPSRITDLVRWDSSRGPTVCWGRGYCMTCTLISGRLPYKGLLGAGNQLAHSGSNYPNRSFMQIPRTQSLPTAGDQERGPCRQQRIRMTYLFPANFPLPHLRKAPRGSRGRAPRAHPHQKAYVYQRSLS